MLHVPLPRRAPKPPEHADDPERGLLLRLSVVGTGPHGEVVPDPKYGGQLQDRSILGVKAEGEIRITAREVSGRYADGTRYTLLAPSYEIVDAAYGALAHDVRISPRIAPAVFGVGLLEAVPEREIVAGADPKDANHDGISGRPNRVWDVRKQAMSLGRFGWKANVPTVEQQNAGAFNGDIGITSSMFPDAACTPVETACRKAPNGGDPEVDDSKLERVTFYTRTLAVPARRAVDNDHVRAGEQLFREAACSACHQPTLHTGDADIAALAHQTIHPFTDLLLHDMGPGLTDKRIDGLAYGSEWRTAPLWGIGLVDTVNRHSRFLHDGAISRRRSSGTAGKPRPRWTASAGCRAPNTRRSSPIWSRCDLAHRSVRGAAGRARVDRVRQRHRFDRDARRGGGDPLPRGDDPAVRSARSDDGRARGADREAVRRAGRSGARRRARGVGDRLERVEPHAARSASARSTSSTAAPTSST